MNSLRCSCGGRLHLKEMQYKFIREERIYVFENSIFLECSTCKKHHIPDNVLTICESIVDNVTSRKSDMVHFDFRVIKNHICVDKFISTKVAFLYDRDDYYFIPGLIRPWNKGFLTPLFFNLEVLLKYLHHPHYNVDLELIHMVTYIKMGNI